MSMVDDMEEEFEQKTLADINQLLHAADVAPWCWDRKFIAGLQDVTDTIDGMMDARGYPSPAIPVDNHSSRLEHAIKTIATCTCKHDCKKCNLLIMRHINGGYCMRAVFSLSPCQSQTADPALAGQKGS